MRSNTERCRSVQRPTVSKKTRQLQNRNITNSSKLCTAKFLRAPFRYKMAWGVQFLRCRVTKTKLTINTLSTRQLDILDSAHTRGGEIGSDPPVVRSNTDSTKSPPAAWLLETWCHPVVILDCFRNKMCYKEGNKSIKQVMTYKGVFRSLQITIWQIFYSFIFIIYVMLHGRILWHVWK